MVHELAPLQHPPPPPSGSETFAGLHPAPHARQAAAPLPLAPTSLHSVSVGLPVLHILCNGIMQYVAFGVWPLSQHHAFEARPRCSRCQGPPFLR